MLLTVTFSVKYSDRKENSFGEGRGSRFSGIKKVPLLAVLNGDRRVYRTYHLILICGQFSVLGLLSCMHACSSGDIDDVTIY